MARFGTESMIQLSPDAKSTDQDIRLIPTIASRKTDPNMANPPAIEGNPVDAGGNSIEAPFIFKRKNTIISLPLSIIVAKGEQHL